MALREAKAWVPSKEHAWVLTDVVSFVEDEGTIHVVDPENPEGDNLVLKKEDTHLLDPSHLLSHDDLCKMNRLHDAPLLNVLRTRYQNDDIYSTVGDMILVSANPYRRIPGLYENPLRYYDMPEEGSQEPENTANPPHVFKVANRALHSLINPKKPSQEGGRRRFMNQSIVVSGESGAGKTEASKLVMSYLVEANMEIVKTKTESDSTVDLEEIAHKIQKEVVGSNLVFEAFGNAKTVRNDNSSRFGKYIKLQYSDDNMLLSAYTDTFLLEKSRILTCNPGESNYHIFYYMVDGLKDTDPTLAKEFGLETASYDQFRVLNDSGGGCSWADRGDEENLDSLQVALANVDFTPEEQKEIFRLLAAILHLGNVKVSAASEDSGNISLEGSTMQMKDVAGLLGIEPSILHMKLTQRIVRIRGRSSMATKQLNQKEVNNNLNAFIKMIYTGVFSFIVRKINYAHSHPDQVAGQQPSKFIGILDIFGFEIFQNNSFEQLCINFANERLQQHFNEHVFVAEQEDYEREGLDGSFITFSDNQDVIDLVTKKPSGLFCIMDDFAKVNKTDDTQLLINLNQANESKNDRYTKPRLNYQESFVVHHFAGSVTYTIGADKDSFLFKNNDSLEEGLVEGVQSSENVFFRSVSCYVIGVPREDSAEIGYIPDLTSVRFGEEELESINNDETKHLYSKSGKVNDGPPQPPTAAGGKQMASSKTISKRFVAQVNRLMATLQVTEPHYIKCMKPNTSKKSGLFEGPLMLEQLRYSGVLEVVRIRREGFPWCNSYVKFYEEFEILGIKKQLSGDYPAARDCSEEQARQIADDICTIFLGEQQSSGENPGAVLYAYGNISMYLREEGYNSLSGHMNVLLDRCATIIQADIRRSTALRDYRKSRKAVVKLQAWGRMIAKVTWKAAELARLARLAAIEAERLKEEEEERQRLAAIAAAEVEEAGRLEADRLRILAEKEAVRLAAEAAEAERVRLEQVAVAEDKQRVVDFMNASNSGDVAAMKALLAEYPDLATRKSMNDEGPRYSAFQKACLGCAFEAMGYLNPAPHEIHAKDSQGYNALLLALSADNSADRHDMLDVCQYLSKACSENFPVEDSYEVEDYVESRADKWAAADQNALAFNVGTEEERATGAVLKEGWLSKMHNTYLFSASWGKRWVRLTDSALLYFREADDKLPRDSVSLTKETVHGMSLDYFAGPSGPAVKISFNNKVQSGLKGRTQISLMAADATEMEEWDKPLKAIMGMINGDAAMDEDLGNNWSYINPSVERALVTAVGSKTANTGLHVLALKKGGEHKDNDKYSASVAAWLVGKGVRVDTANCTDEDGKITIHKGVTALHLACKNSNLPLAKALVNCGAKVQDRIAQLIEENFADDAKYLIQDAARYAFGSLHAHAKPPIMKNYTYLSMFFMRQAFMKPMQAYAEHDTHTFDPVIVVSVMSRQHELVEAQQVISMPVHSQNDSSIWWGKMWHLQTPLDNTSNDAVVVVETRSTPHATNYVTLGWFHFNLMHSLLHTSAAPDVLQMHEWTGETKPTIVELSDMAGRVQQQCVEGPMENNNVQVEVILSRKDSL